MYAMYALQHYGGNSPSVLRELESSGMGFICDMWANERVFSTTHGRSKLVITVYFGMRRHKSVYVREQSFLFGLKLERFVSKRFMLSCDAKQKTRGCSLTFVRNESYFGRSDSLRRIWSQETNLYTLSTDARLKKYL